MFKVSSKQARPVCVTLNTSRVFQTLNSVRGWNEWSLIYTQEVKCQSDSNHSLLFFFFFLFEWLTEWNTDDCSSNYDYFWSYSKHGYGYMDNSIEDGFNLAKVEVPQRI